MCFVAFILPTVSSIASHPNSARVRHDPHKDSDWITAGRCSCHRLSLVISSRQTRITYRHARSSREQYGIRFVSGRIRRTNRANNYALLIIRQLTKRSISFLIHNASVQNVFFFFCKNGVYRLSGNVPVCCAENIVCLSYATLRFSVFAILPKNRLKKVEIVKKIYRDQLRNKRAAWRSLKSNDHDRQSTTLFYDLI